MTFPAEEGLGFDTGAELEVTWDVAGTDGGDVNTPTVDILYSDDNGETFITLQISSRLIPLHTVVTPQRSPCAAPILCAISLSAG